MIQRNKQTLTKYIGKILLREANGFVWLFKLVDVVDDDVVLTTQGIDIFPKFRAYRGFKYFLNSAEENIKTNQLDSQYAAQKKDELRLPTKQELNTYIKIRREIIFLGKIITKQSI